MIIRDIRYRPTLFPKATGEVVLESKGGRKVKLGFTSRIKEHFLMEMAEVLAFGEHSPADEFPARLTPAEERSLQIAIFKQEFVGRRLWLVRDVPCTADSKQLFLPAGTEVRLDESSVVVQKGVGGEEVLSWLEFADGKGSTVAVYLQQPHRSFAEWHAQAGEVVTVEERTPGLGILPTGLSREAVFSSWGPPDRRRGRLSNSGVREEWIYDLRGETLVFVDGRLAGR